MAEPVIFIVPNTEPLVLSEKDGALTYRKELIYAGDFVKKNKQGEQRFGVNAPLLDHWHHTSMSMIGNGVEIPLPDRHTEDAGFKRGTLVKTERGVNEKGLPALFGFIRFNDEGAANKYKHSNVSIFADPDGFTDGKGNTYHYPIRHVAITDYPVIPGLGKFQALAASLVEETKTMALDLRALAGKLGVESSTADGDLEGAIETAIAKLLEQVEASKGEPAKEPPPKEPVAASLSPVVLSLVRDNRNAKIDALVVSRKITPAVAKKLKDEFCADQKLTLALSHNVAAPTDGFDSAIGAFTLNEPYLPSKEQTCAQVLELSQNDINSVDKNPVLKNAKERAEAAKK